MGVVRTVEVWAGLVNIGSFLQERFPCLTSLLTCSKLGKLRKC